MSSIIKAHKHSSYHRQEIEESTLCACFYCLATFPAQKISEWVDWPENTPEEMMNIYGQTAICPFCGIDSVIGDKSGYPINENFLQKMHDYWF